MTKLLFKAIFFIFSFIFSQTVVMPWLMQETNLPLWADILIISSLLMLLGMIFDYLITNLKEKFIKRKSYEEKILN